jgi:hypothetical protein
MTVTTARMLGLVASSSGRLGNPFSPDVAAAWPGWKKFWTMIDSRELGWGNQKSAVQVKQSRLHGLCHKPDPTLLLIKTI